MKRRKNNPTKKPINPIPLKKNPKNPKTQTTKQQQQQENTNQPTNQKKPPDVLQFAVRF